MSAILLYLFRKIFVIWIHFSACCICIVLMKMRNSNLISFLSHSLVTSVVSMCLCWHIRASWANGKSRYALLHVWYLVFRIANTVDRISSCLKGYTKYIRYIKTLTHSLIHCIHLTISVEIEGYLLVCSSHVCVYVCVSIYHSHFTSSCHAEPLALHVKFNSHGL